jgi:tripartite-type tricarboxylate transporter receptor subunit TctC
MLAAIAQPAQAQEFYKRNTVTIVVSAGAGGGYSIVAQVLSRHLGKKIPGEPNVILQHMPAAGGLVAANYLYNAAPANGATIGLLRNGTSFGQAIGVSGVKYDATRFHWIGSSGPVINVLAARKDSGVTTLDRLMSKELIIGASASKIDTLYILPTIQAKVFGHRIKVVVGYKGSRDVMGALDRKEVDGLVQPYSNWERSHLHKQGAVGYLVQYGYTRMKGLPGVPTLVELARNDDERRILRLVSSPSVFGRNVAAPPKAPRERVEILRRAYEATMKDPAFIADMKKSNRLLEPMTGEEVQALVNEILATPKALIERTRNYLGLGKA